MPLSTGLFTTIGTNGVVRSAAQMDSAVFLETSPNGPIGATGLHFNSINIEMFNDPLGVKIVANKRKVYNSSASRIKTMATTSFSGVINPNEWVYLMSAARGRVTATTPTHVGKYVLTILAVGNYQITNGTLTTAAIASTATQTAIEAELISTFGRGFGEVVQETPTQFSVIMWGEYAVRNSLTLVAAGVALLVATINPTGLGVFRHEFDLSNVDLANLQTMRIYQGPFDIAGAGKRYNYAGVSGFGMDVGVDDVTCKGNMYSFPGLLNQTILSSILTDIPTVSANALEWNFFLGTAKSGASGPVMLCDSTMFSFNIENLLEPYRVIGCNTRSFKGLAVGKANTAFELTLVQDADADALREVAETSTIMYFVAEWQGQDIIAGAPHRVLVMLPVILTTFDNSEEGAVATYKLSGEIASTATLTPRIIVDCAIPTVVP